ncbi:hypothetical protein [Acidiphilium acidophilum]|uniref:hypothetical protein n=1 Tax=Acidiphilium acidophilum TaxID=76588 RepID=UPI002E8E6AFD|nr:hypothetical protein [Acidiphilium acidophilum]
MPRPDLIAAIEALWRENRDEGWNIAYDIAAEIGLDAFTDDALEAIAARCGATFGENLPGGPTPAGQMSLAI